MFCRNCGNQLDDRAIVCPQCGVPTGVGQPVVPQMPPQPPAQIQKRDNPLAIVGFVLSFFCALAGLICSIIGYNKCKSEGLDNRGLALAGIIISAISMGVAVIVFCIWFFWFSLLVGIGTAWQTLLPLCL